MSTRKKSTEDFIKKSLNVHGKKYDYSEVNYVNSRNKVTIICEKHGEFEQTAQSHMRGFGCKKCGTLNSAKKHAKMQDLFLSQCFVKHGSKYDYSLVDYKNCIKKIKIICRTHGIFEQSPENHLLYSECCPECLKNIHYDDFIKQSCLLHKDKYDYSLVKYSNSKKKVIILCPIHGKFTQTPDSHKQGRGCFKCGVIKCAESKILNTECFINQAKKKHGNIYDYSCSEYVKANVELTIKCHSHGFFSQLPSVHLGGHGCKLCSIALNSNKKRKCKTYFIEKSQLLHNDKYNYSLVEYFNNSSKVKIICPIHGIFEQAPSNHYKCGCPKCKSSKGEKNIREYLINKKYNFSEQVSFSNCKYKKKLRFDFMIIKENIKYLIEFQGGQHFTPVKWSNKMSDDEILTIFDDIVRRDKIKQKYCQENQINLLLISYLDLDNIEYIIHNFLKEKNEIN